MDMFFLNTLLQTKEHPLTKRPECIGYSNCNEFGASRTRADRSQPY